MKLLLDTHIFLWALDDSPQLTEDARTLITSAENECYVSAVSFWEIAIKASLRRKDFRVNPEALVQAADTAGLVHLPFVAAHAVQIAKLPRHHADPFDRALIAQAFHEPLTLLTSDQTLSEYGSAIRIV